MKKLIYAVLVLMAAGSTSWGEVTRKPQQQEFHFKFKYQKSSFEFKAERHTLDKCNTEELIGATPMVSFQAEQKISQVKFSIFFHQRFIIAAFAFCFASSIAFSSLAAYLHPMWTSLLNDAGFRIDHTRVSCSSYCTSAAHLI